MNLVGMLGKMLLSNAMGGRGGGGNVLGSLLGGGGQQGGAGGLGGLLGGGNQQQGGGGLLGGGNQQQGGGGLGGLLGGLAGGQQQGGAGGGLGGMLGQVLGGGAQQGGGAAAGGLGGLLGGALGQAQGGQVEQPQQADNDNAALMIRAMLNAAKSDGEFDEQEQQNIVGKLGGDIGPEEAQFIRDEVAKPLDVNGFVKSVPRGMEKQVYLLSLMAITLDNKAEAEYLDQLAKGLNITEQESNQLHAEVGVPQLYS